MDSSGAKEQISKSKSPNQNHLSKKDFKSQANAHDSLAAVNTQLMMNSSRANNSNADLLAYFLNNSKLNSSNSRIMTVPAQVPGSLQNRIKPKDNADQDAVTFTEPSVQNKQPVQPP